MLRKLRSLKVMSFVGLAFGAIMLAEAGQALAEGFLLDEENQMTQLVNEHRASISLGSLAPNDALRNVARRQAQRMVVAGYIYHNPDLGKEASEAVPGWLLVGENVGVGPSVDAVETAFLNSPKHRENIETGRFNIIGLGAMASTDGQLYFTQNFAHWSPKAAPVAPAATARPVTPPVVVTPKPKPVVTPKPVVPAVPVAPVVAGKVETPKTTPVATPVPEVKSVAAKGLGKAESGTKDINVATGLGAMFARFFTKLAFWN